MRRLWSLGDTELVTSLYALEEARRNLRSRCQEALPILDELVSQVSVVSGGRVDLLTEEIDLPDKDIPILLAAIGSSCTHLLTGDTRHFRELYGRTVSGVLVLTPARYLQSSEETHPT